MGIIELVSIILGALSIVLAIGVPWCQRKKELKFLRKEQKDILYEIDLFIKQIKYKNKNDLKIELIFKVFRLKPLFKKLLNNTREIERLSNKKIFSLDNKKLQKEEVKDIDQKAGLTIWVLFNFIQMIKLCSDEEKKLLVLANFQNKPFPQYAKLKLGYKRIEEQNYKFLKEDYDYLLMLSNVDLFKKNKKQKEKN